MKLKIYVTATLISLLFFGQITAQDSRIWSTYFGSFGGEGGFSVATDQSGNVFLAGITGSQTGLATPGGYQNTFGGGTVDAYLIKLNSIGQRQWATYYGGSGNEMNLLGGKLGIATDLAGNVFLAGLTNSTNNIAANGHQNSPGGTMNAYLAKFDASGNRLWGTYYGGTFGYGYSVATDFEGNVYLAGTTQSTTGISVNGFQSSFGGSRDAFLAKFNAAGNIIWATYCGGADSDEGWNVCTDASGNVYLAGFTSSTGGIAAGGFQNSYGGGDNDAFVVKYDSAGTRLWGTYFGGSGDEMELYAGDVSVAADINGNVYLTGLTTSTNGLASGGHQNTFGGGGQDAFLVKFDPTGSRVWSTYYGGSDNDRGYSVATDVQGNVFMVGRTSSTNGIASGGFQNTPPGVPEAFIATFDPAGNRLCASYYGWTGVEDANDVAVDDAGHVYLAGGTEDTINIASGGFQNFYGGGTFDAMLVKFSACTTTGVHDADLSSSFQIYPNPTRGIIRISGIENLTAKIQISDIQGKVIYQMEKLQNGFIVDLTEYADGLYFVRISTDTETFDKSFVIRRD
jgi:hypothetical protein